MKRHSSTWRHGSFFEIDEKISSGKFQLRILFTKCKTSIEFKALFFRWAQVITGLTIKFHRDES